MNDADRIVSSILTALVVAGVGYALALSCQSHAQPDVPDGLLLDALRVRISEADFRPECEGEHRGVWYPRGCVTDGSAIIERHWAAAKRRGTTLHQELRAYSRRATGQRTPRSPRGAWVAGLSLDFTSPPQGWPSNIPWASRVPILEQIRDELRTRLRLALAYQPVRVCAGGDHPDHWGGIECSGSRRGACDRVPSCWRRLDCGPTVNAFYAVDCPSRASMSRRSRNPTLPAETARGD